MLIGVTKLNLDAKGRMTIPSRYRQSLLDDCAGRLIITIDTEKHLVIFPYDEWQEVEAKLMKLSMSKAAVKIKRFYLVHAADSEMDKNGRINLPPYLREMTGLKKQIVLLGMGKKFEVWDEDSWNAEMQNDEDLDLSAELESLNF